MHGSRGVGCWLIGCTSAASSGRVAREDVRAPAAVCAYWLLHNTSCVERLLMLVGVVKRRHGCGLLWLQWGVDCAKSSISDHRSKKVQCCG